MNKIVLTSLAGLLFAVLAYFHVALPTSFTQDGFVAVALLAVSAVTGILRFYHGDPLADAKSWWASKTIWTAIVGFVFAALALFGIAPGLDQATVLSLLMAAVTAAGSIFGLTASKPIA